MLSQAVLMVAIPCLLAYACFSDLFTMRISNRVCMLVFGLFPIAALQAGMALPDIGWHIATGFAVLVISFSLFAFGWVGGGDAKLVAAVSVWLGFDLVLQYLALTCIAGGGLTLALLYMRRHPLPERLYAQPWIAHLHAPTTGVPYGIALGAVALFVLPETAIWKLAV
jgi:prepilin peptidase CpaA